MAVRDVVQAAAGVGGAGEYIEDVFSTYLYTGNGSTQTITNGIDLDGEGGLAWIKSRSDAKNHSLTDTVRGGDKTIYTNGTFAEESPTVMSFNSDGWAWVSGNFFNTNLAGQNYVSWTFRKARKFFDIQTWTGSGVNRIIPHDLGSVPGCIMVKCITGGVESWAVWHNSLTDAFSASTNYLILNSTDAQQSSTNRFDGTQITSTGFGVKRDGNVNDTGKTYVAYLFAHDAGGFGDDGLQNVISCGSYVGNNSINGPTITLGYEPQFLLVKDVSSGRDWWIVDTMRGMSVGGLDWRIRPNTSAVDNNSDAVAPTATGFKLETSSPDVNASGNTYIYIAIRRGPMKTPESGTEVFYPALSAATTGTKITTGFTVDMQINKYLIGANNHWVIDRLRGAPAPVSEESKQLITNAITAESSSGGLVRGWDNTGFQIASGYANASSIYWNFRRAPGFFDVVAYTGNGTAGSTVAHNLGVAPEMMIIKARNDDRHWIVYHSSLGATKFIEISSTGAAQTNNSYFYDTEPTSTEFTIGSASAVNRSSSYNYVAYLFATLPGVSKLGTYAGNGTSQNIDCGFSSGARFILIKRTDVTDSTGNWYVWDSARGIVSGNDPYEKINAKVAEVTSYDSVDPLPSGFTVNYDGATEINKSGASYIFLAIA